MGDDHVAEGAGLLVEAGAARDGERLGDVDLDVVDVISVPDRLEEAVGEAQGEDVLDRLLAEEVVDAEDVRLAEDGVHGRVELLRAREIDAERLLDDDARALGEAGLAEHRHDPGKRRRRDGEVVHAARLAADLPLRLLDGPDELRRIVGVGGGEGEAGDELVPALPGRLAHAALLDGVVRTLAKLLVGERARRARDADHAVVLGHEAGAVEVEEARQELALGEIARRPEEHDHVVVRTRPRVDRHATASATFAVRSAYAAAGSSCQKTALPATSRSAPASRISAAFSAETPPSTCTEYGVRHQGAQFRDAAEGFGHERLSGKAGVDAHAKSNVHIGRTGSRPLDLRLGVEGDADAEAQLTCVRDGSRRVVDRLDMERHAVAAGLTNALEVPFRLGDHEVAVEHSSLLVYEPGDRAQHDRPDGDLADEVAVADVEVEDAGAGVEQALQLLAEAGEVRGVDRRLDDARPCPLRPSHPLTVSR